MRSVARRTRRALESTWSVRESLSLLALSKDVKKTPTPCRIRRFMTRQDHHKIHFKTNKMDFIESVPSDDDDDFDDASSLALFAVWCSLVHIARFTDT